MLADFFRFELRQILAGPVQHARRSFARQVECTLAVMANQYLRLIRAAVLLRSATAVASRGAGVAPVARLVPWRAVMRANRTSGVASAAAGRTLRSSQAGRNNDRKNLRVITLAAFGIASSDAADRRFLTRWR